EELWSLTPLWWSSLSFTQSPNNLIILQLAKLSGFATITAAIVLVNLLLAEAIILVKQNSSLLILPLVCFFSLHLLGFYFYQQPITKDNQNLLNVGIVQGNIPNEIKLYPAGWRQAINGYITGYQKLAQQGVDLVITPETALPFYWQDLIQSSSNLYQVVTKAKTPILVGAFGKKKQGYTNSLFLLTGEGKTFSRYDKYKLVPIGEYIPFESVFGKIIDRLSPLDAHLIKGEANQIVNSPFGQFIVGICYESAFSHHFRRQAKAGGKFIITASNNAHYSSAMPAQHHAQDIIRAIETDRWAARATNTGYSGIVDPHGNTVWLSELNTYQLYTGEIYTRATQTLYVKYGDWLTVFLLVMTAVTLTLGITRARLTEL
ncbi:MAG: apolipoprotein N-acyltransferase, partial [Cyanobacteria bacterium J083]